MFAKHLPPSAEVPRVLALDEASAQSLPEEVEVTRTGREGEQFDAIVGYASPETVARWQPHLRPGGRLILVDVAPAESLLTALTRAGYIHCLVEPHGELCLYRGERPPLGNSVERLGALVAPLVSPAAPFICLLVTQTPNKPAWKQAADEKLAWQAATVIDPATSAPVLLAFTSLVKAVAFMQSAVLAQFIVGVNKVVKFPAEAAATWKTGYVLNPEFDRVRGWQRGPQWTVDPQAAITGGE
jgi:hypothetical protein